MENIVLFFSYMLKTNFPFQLIGLVEVKDRNALRPSSKTDNSWGLLIVQTLVTFTVMWSKMAALVAASYHIKMGVAQKRQ